MLLGDDVRQFCLLSGQHAETSVAQDALGHGLIGRAFDEQQDAVADDGNVLFSKDDEPALPSRIRRIYYINVRSRSTTICMV